MKTEIDDRPPDASILIVEDHLETRTFLELALSENYRVDTATDAPRALEMTTRSHYDLLLVDIALGEGINGVELVERLRAEPPFENVPIVATTAHQFREDRDYYLERGFDEYLPKPYFPQELFGVVERMLATGREARPARP